MRTRKSRSIAIALASLVILSGVLDFWWGIPVQARSPAAQLGIAQPAAAASITLSKNAYPPTALLAVSGTGFGVSENIDLFFDTTDLALAHANGSGAFSGIVIQVPASSVPGTHWVTAKGRTSSRSAQ